MHPKTLILAASLTLLGTAPAAWAQNDPPPEHRYPDSAHIERVIGVAQDMSRTAAYMSREAERNNRRPNDAEGAMLDRLRELTTRAKHFEGTVEQFRQSPERTSEDFQALVSTFDATADALRTTNRRPYIDRGMAHIARLMDELSPYYGRTGDFRERHGYRDQGDDSHRDNNRDRDNRPPVR
jgi:uncharacterized membrane protein YccC